MTKHIFKIITLIFFLGSIKVQGQEKKLKKEEIMATIICECLENAEANELANNFEDKLNDCYKASVLGALLNEIPTDKDSSITLNADGTSDKITNKDRKRAVKLLEKNCEIYNDQIAINQRYNEGLRKAADVACLCINEIPTTISTEEKNNYISECVTQGVVDTKAIRELELNTVEAMKGIISDVQRVLVNDCPALKKVAFSNDEEKLFSYSSNREAAEYYNKGISESEKGNFKKALKNYKKAVELDDKFVFAWDNLGRTYRELHQYDKAIEAYKKSMAIDSLNPTPLMNIAVVYNYKEDYESSSYWYNKLIEAYPNNPEGHYGLSLSYMYSNKLESSLNSIIKAYKLYKEAGSPYVADAEKVMQYLYNMFEEQDKEDRFKEICKEQNIKLN